MKAFDKLGKFWIAGQDGESLSGRIQYDPTGGGINLTLVGMFGKIPVMHSEPNLQIHGEIGSDEVTLDRCFSLGVNVSSGVAESRFYANQMFYGAHLEGEISFSKAHVELGWVGEWVGKSGIQEKSRWRSDDDLPEDYRLSFVEQEVETCEFPGGNVSIGLSWKAEGDEFQGITFRQWPVFVIEYDEDHSFEEIRKDVGRLESFVTLCMDTSVASERLILRHPDINVIMINGDVSRFEQEIEFIATPLKYKGDKVQRGRSAHKNLISFQELGGISTVARWLERSKRFERPLDSLMSVGRARQMYVENRFLNTAGAAESFHRGVYGGTYMDPTYFSELIEKYVEITPDEYKNWLAGRIKYGNDWALRKRLQDLANRASGAIEPLVGNKRRWANLVSEVRNNVTHLGKGPSPFEGGDLHFLTESVYAAVRICMLLDSGVPLDVLSEKVTSSDVYWYRERLRASMVALAEALKTLGS